MPVTITHPPVPPGRARAGLRTRPVPRCPRCTAVLDGGPVAYHCGRCGRGVMAADLDTTWHPPAPRSIR
jgi:hypothetical protein